MDEPIATYDEARFELRRHFELFPDRVRVVGKGMQLGRFDAIIPLATLYTPPSRLWVRGLIFRWGIGLLVGVMVGLGVVLALRGWSWPALIDPGVIAWFGGALVVSLALVLPRLRGVEFVRFHTDAGVVVLDVGKTGPRVGEFETFVDLLVAQIETCRRQV